MAGCLRSVLVMLLVMAGSLTGQSIGERYDKLTREAMEHMRINKKQALDMLAEAKKLIPGTPLAYVYTGGILLNYPVDRIDEAQREFQHALALCNTREQLKNTASLMEIFSQAFYKDGSYELYEKGKALNAEDRCREAIPILRQAVKLNLRNSLTPYELGYAFADVEEFDSALVYLERARKLNPGKYAILNELAFCYSQEPELEKLEQVVAEAEFLAGEQPYLKRLLALGYNEKGMYDMALAILEDSFAKFPDFFLTAYSMGNIYARQKNDLERAGYYMQKFKDGVLGNNSKEASVNVTGGGWSNFIERADEIIGQAKAAEQTGP